MSNSNTKSKHTPGPWRLNGNRTITVGDFGKPGSFIAEVKNDANARLIAAAPELLEALEWLLHHVVRTQGLDGPELNHVRETIAKATGGVS